MNEEINIFKCLDYIRDHAKQYAQARASRVYIEEFRKTLKARLMSEHIGEPVNAQERYAYAHNEYAELLEGLKPLLRKKKTCDGKLKL